VRNNLKLQRKAVASGLHYVSQKFHWFKNSQQTGMQTHTDTTLQD
jgi:hypothetical protein